MSFPQVLSASQSSGGRPLGHLAPPLGRAPVGRLVLRCRTVGTAFGRNGGNPEKKHGSPIKTFGDDKLFIVNELRLLHRKKCRTQVITKFRGFDNGVTRALLGTLQDRPHPAEKRRLFEQWVIQELMRINEYEQKDWKFSFWRTAHGAESASCLR